MKNIITIDFDIIMAPSIELYNNMVPNLNWKELQQRFPQMQLLNTDLIHYSRLSNWIYDIIHKISKEQIIFIENHGAIVKYLPNETINIYNIDHHHDCGYGELKEEQEELNCGNWVYDIQRHGYLNHFYWIKNNNSNSETKYKNLITNEYNLSEYELNNLPQPDLLILCLSEPWTPPQSRPLFYLWKEILEKYYGTKFDMDYQVNFEGVDYYGTLQ